MPNLRDPTSLHIELSDIHPAPRLQHSPSLPNIYFASHPGHGQPAMQPEKVLKDGPSEPLSPKVVVVPSDTTSDKDNGKDKETRPRHVKYASVDPISRISTSRQGSKVHARRRTERDQPHALLTPPLTPSSSIRTTTSDPPATNAKGPSELEPEDTNSKDPLEAFSGLTISTAGAQSNIRQRFPFPGITSEGPKTQEHLVEGAHSPHFFYTTPFGNAPGHGRYQQLDPGLRIGNSMGAGNPPPAALPLCYTPDGICSYCPSRTSPIANYAPYPIPCPTPTPTYYPAQINPNMIQGMMNVPPFPSHPPFLQYEYVESQARPIPGVPQWGFDPAIAAVGPGPNHLVPLVPVNGPSPTPFFVREEATLLGPPFQTQYQQVPVASVREQLGLNISSPPQPFAHISAPSPDVSPTTYPPHSTHIIKYEATTACGSANAAPPTGNGQCLDKNQLSLARIKAGDDLRTTVMIKNIPNKMSDADLTAYIDKVCPRRIDFLYLRMDFKNGCNVGYAFVNFITVQDLGHFVDERLGAKWNMFSSEKILQMSYANFQGKEALIEKFKNSAIMDEREAWRPRIFYSSGENQGLPEPFPAPTHIRRKERGSVNRGTLYPPGANSHHHPQRRYHDECRYLQNRPNEGIPARLRAGQLGPVNALGGTRQRGGGPADKASLYHDVR